MSNFRILILVFLVVVLAVLGMIYVNISSRMDVIQQQQIAPVPAPAAVNPSPYLPMPTQTPGTAVQPVVVADPVVSEELAHATAELERMKKENEDLKKRHAMAEEERALQQQRLADHLKGIDVVVCTAAVPGRPGPKIITAAMVAGMKPGSVIVDLAAETGGNCELTRPGETYDAQGVTIAGPLNLASLGAVHASEMYARNVFNFVSLFVKDGALQFDWNDELLAKTVWPERSDASAQAA